MTRQELRAAIRIALVKAAIEELPHRPADPKTPNRRTRAAYNAYQREYMRKRRAAERAAK